MTKMKKLIPIAWQNKPHGIGAYGEIYKKHFGLWQEADYVMNVTYCNLTHIPTGFCVAKFLTKKYARLCVDKLLNKFPDITWSSADTVYWEYITQKSEIVYFIKKIVNEEYEKNDNGKGEYDV